MPKKENLKNSKIRIRDEGFIITMTIKTKTEINNFDEEKEIIIDNFETGIDMLLILGCEKDAYHEKIREIWTIKNTEIIFDIGPGYTEIMEIESKTIGELKNMVKLFNLIVIPKNERKNLFVELFGIDMKEIYKIKNITFINAKKILTPLVLKNKKNLIY
jgi:adenylate cyclase class IV